MVLVAGLIALAIISCQKTEKLNPASADANSKIATILDTMEEICSSYTADLLAGQNILVGTISVSNNSESLFVTYTTTGDWKIESIHLFAGKKDEAPTTKSGNPVVGQFPIQESFSSLVNTVTYEIPVENIRHCLIVAAHADVVQVVDGKITDRQTAWGAGKRFVDKGNWATYIEYCPGTCPITIGDLCYEKSIGWTDGTLYAPQSKCWATYVTYSPGITADLIADNTEVAGTVHFSAMNGSDITITITLNTGYIPNGAVQFTKIQGYADAPTSKPHPPDFTTYKGKSLVVTVPYYPYYGVHLDMLREVPCP